MRRLFVFGDIHGELKKLESLLSKVSFDQDDILVFLGDYVNRGPNSYGVIEKLLELNKKFSCIFLKGNHDHIFFTDVLFNGQNLNEETLSYWNDGANKTMESYVAANYNPEDHLENFYRILKPYFLYDNRLFVHAGYNRNLSLEEQKFSDILWFDRTLVKQAISYEKLDVKTQEFSNQDGFENIYIGHTPVQNWGLSIPNKWGNVWDLDTGSGKYKNGRVSCMEIYSETIFQSDF